MYLMVCMLLSISWLCASQNEKFDYESIKPKVFIEKDYQQAFERVLAPNIRNAINDDAVIKKMKISHDELVARIYAAPISEREEGLAVLQNSYTYYINSSPAKLRSDILQETVRKIILRQVYKEFKRRLEK